MENNGSIRKLHETTEQVAAGKQTQHTSLESSTEGLVFTAAANVA